MSVSRAAAEEIVRDAYRRRLENDVAAVAPLFVADAVIHVPGSTAASAVAARAEGRVAVEQALTAMVTGWAWLDQTILSMTIEDDRVAVHHRVRMRFLPTGDVVTTEMFDLFTLRDGKIAGLTEFVDTAMAQQLLGRIGVMPSGA